jgi:hypothetical protein
MSIADARTAASDLRLTAADHEQRIESRYSA